MTDHPSIRRGRRAFLAGLAAGALLMPLFAPSARAAIRGERRLRLHNIHTGERIDVVYATADGYDGRALGEIDRLLRDFRTDDVHPIDRTLLDVVADLATALDTQAPFDIISGYRSPATNAHLAARSGGVAKRSYHMRGMAIDLALPGRPVETVRAAARALNAGGVGLYRASGFVHVDTGPVRAW